MVRRGMGACFVWGQASGWVKSADVGISSCGPVFPLVILVESLINEYQFLTDNYSSQCFSDSLLVKNLCEHTAKRRKHHGPEEKSTTASRSLQTGQAATYENYAAASSRKMKRFPMYR